MLGKVPLFNIQIGNLRYLQQVRFQACGGKPQYCNCAVGLLLELHYILQPSINHTIKSIFTYKFSREKCLKTLFQAWVEKHFKKNSRPEIVIFQSENVLTPKSLKEVRKCEIPGKLQNLYNLKEKPQNKEEEFD